MRGISPDHRPVSPRRRRDRRRSIRYCLFATARMATAITALARLNSPVWSAGISSGSSTFRDGWRGTRRPMRPATKCDRWRCGSGRRTRRRCREIHRRPRVHRPMTTVRGNARSHKLTQHGVVHGAAGEGKEELNAPALAGRSDWYLVTQLTNYKAGSRRRRRTRMGRRCAPWPDAARRNGDR